MKKCMKWLALSAAVLGAQAQVSDQIRRAAISGSRGTSGKCTIEVRVDISAEVDVYGDSGRLRTIAGQPATWTRMECTDPLPYNMTNFRFKGIDGRGSVKLAQDPRNNNGMAVIRIDDPRAGSEGYTFDLEWSGASGGAPTDGFSTSGYYPSTPGGTYPATPNTPAIGNRGALFPGRGASRNFSAERAIDLCRTEVRTRGERDYGLRNIDITAAAIDTSSGRRDLVSGAFTDRTGAFRSGSGYRFNCVIDYNSGQVRTVEILRADGSAVQPGSTSGAYNPNAYNQSGYDQTRAIRACQDAVVARTARDGYQNVRFSSTAIDTGRSNWISGTMTATREPITDTFDFGCSMDLGAARVRNLELNRR